MNAGQSNHDKMTVFVTGGAGFIGSHVVDRLIDSGHRVLNLDLLTYAGNLENLAHVSSHPNYSFIRGDIGDSALVKELLAEYRPNVVFNLAAESHVDRSIDAADDFIETNITCVYRLLNSTLHFWRGLDATNRDAFRYIQMSTDETYGSIDVGVFTEESPYEPNSPYAASKAAGDHLVRAFRITHGLPTLIARASNTYGPRQFPEKLIPHMIISALNGRRLPVYGKGTNVRDWMFVGDLASGLITVVDNGKAGEIYNFAGGDEWTNIDTVHALCKYLDKATPGASPYQSTIDFVADRPGHDARYAMSYEKVKNIFGWRPRVRFAEGLPMTIDWYLANKDWWQSIVSKGYQAKRIGQPSV